MEGLKGFPIGNQGKPVGTKNKKTKQWEMLRDSITGEHADTFNEIMSELGQEAKAGDKRSQILFIDSFIKIMKFFRPTAHAHAHDIELTKDITIHLSDTDWEEI